MGEDFTSVFPMEQIQNDPLTCQLIYKFKDSFESSPAFIVRVPGRVNLIGEHIDYCGFSVLPMALEQHILIAVKPMEDTILKLVNLDTKYLPYEGNLDNLNINTSNGVFWHSYVLCGIRGMLETIKEGQKKTGMLLAVTGNIPPNSGLSSSSALVCAAALAAAQANKLNLAKQEIASLCAQSERYVGTAGGGMDQAIAFLAKSGCAKFISFKPLRASDVILPPGVAIVVAHSLAELNKAASGHFNHRVAECRLASLILAKCGGLPNWRKMSVLADVLSELRMSLPEIIQNTKDVLSKDVYSKDEICEILDIGVDELDHCFLPENTRETKSFKLCQRATHVFEETLRVTKFREICCNGGSPVELGQLMNLSHDSLRNLYECSHPQMDQLVSIARESGAFGARLTGAGWGGCMVALTTVEHVPTFISTLKEKFYFAKDMNEVTQQLIFYSQPGSGAAVFH